MSVWQNVTRDTVALGALELNAEFNNIFIWEHFHTNVRCSFSIISSSRHVNFVKSSIFNCLVYQNVQKSTELTLVEISWKFLEINVRQGYWMNPNFETKNYFGTFEIFLDERSWVNNEIQYTQSTISREIISKTQIHFFTCIA